MNERNVPDKQSGFVLLAVVLAIIVLAAIAFALNDQGASRVNVAAGELERDQLRYVAEAGMAHARLQLAQNTSCSGYTDIPKTDFGADSYRATFSTNKDSPITIKSTGLLQSGAEFTLQSDAIKAYSAPSVVTVQLDTTAGKDTMIDSFYANANYGRVDDLTVRSKTSWIQRPLLEFVLAKIPPSVRIISAKLELQQRIVGTAGVIGVHRVSRSWEEGTGNGTGNADGATWNEYDGASSWAQPGGDFASTLYATTATTSAKNGGWVAWDIRDLVQEWVSGQSPNYGLMLVGDGVVDNAEFQSREEPDPAAAPKLTIAYACECGKTCGVAPSGKNVLLIVGNDTTLASKDVGYKALMESWGHTVAVIDDGASQADYDTAMAAADVIYASGSAVGSSMLDKATYTTKGMVNEVNGKIDNFGFSSSTSATTNFDAFSATNAAHYITEPFTGSAVTVFTSSLTNPIPGGTLAPDLQTVGEVSGTPSLVTLDAGATGWNGNPVPARRAHLPFTSAETTDMTADGKTILQRTLEWAAGLDGSTGPIAHWKLDEGTGTTAIDSVGDNDATLNGDPTWVAGTLGGALDFDGSGDYVTTDSPFTPPPIGTVTFWMNVSGSPAAHGRILGLGDTWEIRHVTTGTPDGIPYGLVFDLGVTGVNTEFVTTTTVDTPGHWYHIAATYDTNTDAYAVYVDGVPHKSGTYSSPLAVPAASLLSLGTRTGSTNYFDGILDDVRVYDTMLSASKIADLADGGGGGDSSATYTELHQNWINSSDATWETVDLSTFGVPANAVVEVAITNAKDKNERWGGARAVGSTLERGFSLHESEGGGVDSVVMHVQANADSRIQLYSEKKGELTFTVIGYWTGAAYVERFAGFSAGGSNSWREHSLAAYGVGANQVAEIALINTNAANERLAGLRPSGSSLQRRLSIHEAESGGIDAATMMVNTDASAIVEVYAATNADVDFYVLGHWSSPPGTYTEIGGLHGQVSNLLTWESHDLGSYGVPPDSVAQFITSNESNGADVEIGVRQTGSSLNRLFNLQEAEDGGSDTVSVHVNVDGSSRVEWYAQYGSNLRFFYPVGWWVLN